MTTDGTATASVIATVSDEMHLGTADAAEARPDIETPTTGIETHIVVGIAR